MIGPRPELDAHLAKASGLVRNLVHFVDDDLIQVARIAMWRASTTYNPDIGTLEGWMRAKARWAVLDEYRRRVQVRTLPIPDDETAHRFSEHHPDPSEQIEATVMLASRLAVLSDRDRAIVARRLAGAELAEIGREFGLTDGRVSQIICKFGLYRKKGRHAEP